MTLRAGKRTTGFRVIALSGGLFVIAATSAGISVSVAGLPAARSWFDASPFLVVLAAAGYLIVQYQHRDQVDSLDLVEAVLAPAIFFLPTVVVVSIVALSTLLAEAIHRPGALKSAFNVAQWSAAAGVGCAAFSILRDGSAITPRNIAALVAALIIVAVVNQLAFVLVMSIVRRESVRAVLRSFSPVILPGWVAGFLVNLGFGALFVAAYQAGRAGVALFLVPLVALHLASRGLAATAADRARLSAMHTATSALAVPVDPRVAIPRFLEGVRRCFEAETVDLVLIEDDRRSVHRTTERGGYRAWDEDEDPDRPSLARMLLEHGEVMRVHTSSDDEDLVRLLGSEGWRDCLSAPLVVEGMRIGVLCAYNHSGPQGFEEGELAVLHALAGEASSAIQKGVLLETIAEERQKLLDVVENTSDGIATLAPDGTILMWSPGMEAATGRDAAGLVGSRSFNDLQPLAADGSPVDVEAWASDPTPLPPDVGITTATGIERWLSCSFTRVADLDDNPTSLIIVARDVTRARELERMRSEFIQLVSHELRTPLTPIKGFATIMLTHGDRLPAEKRETGVRTILRQAERLELLLTNLLEVSKIEPRGTDPGEAIVHLEQVALDVLATLRTTHPEREIRLCRDGQDVARGAQAWVKQVLQNLLSNALKYAPADEPIDVRIASNGGTVAVSVVDLGPGIPTDKQAAIFERFERVGDVSSKQEGVGLGLHIASEFARAMGGTLTVDSRPGAGAAFTLTLQAPPDDRST